MFHNFALAMVLEATYQEWLKTSLPRKAFLDDMMFPFHWGFVMFNSADKSRLN